MLSDSEKRTSGSQAEDPQSGPAVVDWAATTLLIAPGLPQETTRQLLTEAYDELHKLAEGFLRHERPNHTLQPTSLVHEVYLRLLQSAGNRVADRTHLRALAARAMRFVLVSYARRHRAAKRGGGRGVALVEADRVAAPAIEVDPVELSDVLERLEKMDSRKAAVVEMRFFGGLTNEEVARVLNVSLSTVEDDWRFARAWLKKELSAP